MRGKKILWLMLLAISPSPSCTEIARFMFNSSQAAEIIFLLHCLQISPYGLAVQRSVTSVVESPLCQTSNSVPNFLLTFSIPVLVLSHNPLSSWHLTPSTSCSHCLYSSSASFCQTRTCAQQVKYLPLATLNDHYWMTCDWTSCSVLLWEQRWANSNSTVVIIGFSTIKPSGKTLNTFNWFVLGGKIQRRQKNKCALLNTALSTTANYTIGQVAKLGNMVSVFHPLD